MESLKTFWRENRSDVWSFFCPQCKIPRRVPYRPKPSVKHYAQVALTSVVFMLLTWNWFFWKGLVVFVPFWIIFEAVYRGRMRAALSCENCGFDPVLYLVDTKRARVEIQDHWKKKFEDRGIAYPPVQTAQKSAKPPAKPTGKLPPVTGIEEELSNSRGSSTTQ